MRRLMILAALTMALALGASQVGAGTASAQEPTGGAVTEIFHFEECDTEPGITACAKSVVHTTQTPSGVTERDYHLQVCVRYTSEEGYSYEECETRNVVSVGQPGEEQVRHETVRGEVTIPGGTCRYTTVFTLANGEVRVDRDGGYDFACEPVR